MNGDGRDELIVSQGADAAAGTGVRVYDYDNEATVSGGRY